MQQDTYFVRGYSFVEYSSRAGLTPVALGCGPLTPTQYQDSIKKKGAPSVIGSCLDEVTRPKLRDFVDSQWPAWSVHLLRSSVRMVS